MLALQQPRVKVHLDMYRSPTEPRDSYKEGGSVTGPGTHPLLEDKPKFI